MQKHFFAFAPAMMLCMATLGFSGNIAAANKNNSSAALEQVMKLAQRANDIADVQNLMGRYAHYTMANHWKDAGELFALKTAGVRATFPFQTKDGAEAVKNYFDTRDDSAQSGIMQQHTLSTLVVEIAGDGKTAKAVWDSPGTETATGEGPGMWAWVKYGVDFIKEEGQWKIWHLRVYPTFRTTYDKSWVQTAKDTAAASSGMSAAPTQSTTWVYNGKGTPPLEPAPPKPYTTFDPKDAYL